MNLHVIELSSGSVVREVPAPVVVEKGQGLLDPERHRYDAERKAIVRKVPARALSLGERFDLLLARCDALEKRVAVLETKP